MMKTGRKKTVYVLAALLVLAAGVALVGNTFATNVVKNNKDPKPAGTDYEVAFQYNAGSAAQPDYKDIKSASNNAITDGMFWCPGRTEIIYLRLNNQQEFPVDATLSLDISGSDFVNTLTYAVCVGNEHRDHPDNWASFQSDTKAKGMLKIGKNQLLTVPLAIDRADRNADVSYLAVAIHMDEQASNEYMNKSVNINFSLRIDANYTPDVTDTENAREDQKDF